MIDPKLLALLRCPIDGKVLVPAPAVVVEAINQAIERRELRDASDGLVESTLEGALLTVDHSRAHAIRGGIPTLIPGESILLPSEIRALANPDATS